MELVFTILLGLVALWGLYSAFVSHGRGRIGFIILAIAAIVQIINVNGEYSMILSIVTTIALLVGIAFARSPVPGSSNPNP